LEVASGGAHFGAKREVDWEIDGREIQMRKPGQYFCEWEWWKIGHCRRQKKRPWASLTTAKGKARRRWER